MKYLFVDSEAAWVSAQFRFQELESQDVRIFCKKKEGKEHLQGIVKHVSTLDEGLRWLTKDGRFMSGDESDVSYLRRLGYRGVGGNAWINRIEMDRLFQMEVCKKAGLDLPNYHAIKTIDEGIAFIKKNPDCYVMKQLGHAPKEWNYAGKEDDGSDVIRQLEWIKQSPQFKKLGGKAPFMLQEIVDGMELAVGAFWMYDDWKRDDEGNVMLEINREHKKMLNGDLGIGCGEMGTVARFTTKDTKLFEQTLEKLTPILKKEAHDVCINVDANCGIVEEDGKDKAYLFEITPRTGFPACALQEYLLSTNSSDFYADLIDGVQGQVEWKKGWGIVTNVGTGDYPHESVGETHIDSFKNQPVEFTPDEHTIPAYLKKDKGEKFFRVADDYEWVSTTCYHGEGIAATNEKCVKAMEKIIVRSPVYRTDIGEKFEKKEIPKLTKMGYL